jgi:hypothetical protein
MRFSIWKYPKFVDEYGSLRVDFSWVDVFKRAGFSTIRVVLYQEGMFWLDDYEYTFFVLRYS